MHVGNLGKQIICTQKDPSFQNISRTLSQKFFNLAMIEAVNGKISSLKGFPKKEKKFWYREIQRKLVIIFSLDPYRV